MSIVDQLKGVLGRETEEEDTTRYQCRDCYETFETADEDARCPQCGSTYLRVP